MERILVVNVNWLGDVVFSSAFFKELKGAYPDSHISCLAVPRVVDVIRSIKEVDDIIEYDERGKDKGLISKAKLIAHLKKESFTRAYLLRPSLTRAMILFFSGIPQRIGFKKKGAERYLTKVVDEPSDPVHRANYYLEVLRADGVKLSQAKTSLVCSEDNKAYSLNLLLKNGLGIDKKIILINTGGNWDLKRWPKANWSQLINELIKVNEYQLVVGGAKKDKTLVEDILEKVDQKKKVINLCGETDLSQLLGLMSISHAVVSADSGPLHLASSVGASCIALFGPTRPELTGPLGTGRTKILQHDVGCNRSACYFLECPDNVCMKAIHVKEVVRGIREIINS